MEESIEAIIEMTVMTEAGTGLETGHFPETIAAILEIGVQAIEGPGQDQEQVQIEKEFDVISVGNTTTLQRTVPLLEKRKKIEQLQQMLNFRDEQTSLTPSISNTQGDFSRTGSEEKLRTGHLNL